MFNYVLLFEGKRAQKYNDFISTWIHDYHKIGEICLEQVKYQKASRLLNVGSGSGAEIKYLFDNGFDGKMIAVDPSRDMLVQAKSIEAVKKGDCRLFLGTVNGLDNEPFDLAFSHLVLHFIPWENDCKQCFLEEVFKRLNKKAVFLIADIYSHNSGFDLTLDFLKSQLIEKNVDPEFIEIGIESLQKECFAITQTHFEKLAKDVGFSTVEVLYQNEVWKYYKLIK